MCVAEVETTSKLLCQLFGWRSIWLHDVEAHEHPRFAENQLGGFGRYVFVDDIEAVHHRVVENQLEIVEDLAVNPNS